MATVKCALGKRGRPSHEWSDGKKDRIYCLGRVDLMTDYPLPECLACTDFVDKAQMTWRNFMGGLTMAKAVLISIRPEWRNSNGLT